MINTRRFLFGAMLFAFSLLVLGSCAGTRPSRFYTLPSISTSQVEAQPSITAKDVVIGVGPVEMPEYLDRPQIITRKGPDQLGLAEFDRWAEPLEKSFPRVLAENLSVLLDTERVVVFPWKRSASVDYQVALSVIRFEGELGGDVVLITRWTVYDKRDGNILLQKRSTISEPTDSESYHALVSAKGRALAELSREIAGAIRAAGH